MAKGDLTKEIEYDKIEVVSTWHIKVRQATKIMEEQADGSKKELNRNFHRHSLQPYHCTKDKDNKWVFTPTDLSNENAKVKGFAELAWDDDTKNAFKTFIESQSI